MAVKMTSAIWEYSQAKGSELLVMLAIADNADDHGKAYPSIQYIAKKTRLTARNVQLLLRKLEKLGELSVAVGDGPHGCNLYRVKTFQGVKSSATEGVKSSARGVKSSALLQPQISPEPSLEPSEEEPIKEKSKTPPLSPKGESASFTAFYELYPKKKAKQDAYKAWQKLKLDPYQAVIMRSVEDHMARDEQWRDIQYIPNPATFLRGKRWEDDLTPSFFPSQGLSKAGLFTLQESERLLAQVEQEDEERIHGIHTTTRLLSGADDHE
jgi:hypothetical protein